MPVVCGLLVSLMVIVLDVVRPRLPSVHTVGCVASRGTATLHVPTGMETLVIDTPAGTVSLIVTFFAVDGPLLETLRFQLIAVPATSVLGPVFVSARSETPVTVRLTCTVLLEASGSGVSLRTTAWLLTSWPSLDVTV